MKQPFARASIGALALALTSSLLVAQRPTSRPSKREQPRTQRPLEGQQARRRQEGQQARRHQEGRRDARQRTDRIAAREFFQSKVEGDQLEANFHKVTRLRWYKSLRSAYRSAANTGKPVLWIQAFGDLRGKT